MTFAMDPLKYIICIIPQLLEIYLYLNIHYFVSSVPDSKALRAPYSDHHGWVGRRIQVVVGALETPRVLTGRPVPGLIHVRTEVSRFVHVNPYGIEFQDLITIDILYEIP